MAGATRQMAAIVAAGKNAMFDTVSLGRVVFTGFRESKFSILG
jgi:hypothetical protein